jgi:hypothetical protein
LAKAASIASASQLLLLLPSRKKHPTHLVEVLLWDASPLVTDAYREVAAA